MGKTGKKGAKGTEALEPQVMPRASAAIAKRGKLPVAEISADERIGMVRKMLDTMENVQTAFGCAAVQIGMELLALKEQTPTGQFEQLFEEQVARPRFTIRTARKYMQAAETVRKHLLKSGHAAEIAESWDVPPSAMTIAKRRKLQDLIGDVLNGKTLSDLLMGDRPAPGGGPGGRPAPTSAEAQLQAVEQVYQELCKGLEREIITHQNWRKLPKEQIVSLREHLRCCLDTVEKGS